MVETPSFDPSSATEFIRGESILIRPRGRNNWKVTRIENMVDGKPVLAVPGAYSQAMLMETEVFECCVTSNGKYRFFNLTVEDIQLKKPAYVALSKPINITSNKDLRAKKRLIVNILSTIRALSGSETYYAIIENISPLGLGISFKGKIERNSSAVIALYLKGKNIVEIMGNSVWDSEIDGYTSLGISGENYGVENAYLLQCVYDFYLNA